MIKSRESTELSVKDTEHHEHTCCVWIQGLRPSEEHLNINYVTTQREGCPNLEAPPNTPPFPCFWRMHHYYPWPHISQDPLRAPPPKKRGNGDITWRRSSLSQAWVAEIVTQPGNAPKLRPSHLTTADAVNKVSPKDSPSKSAKAESFEGCRPWIETQLESVVSLQHLQSPFCWAWKAGYWFASLIKHPWECFSFL